MTIPGGIRVRLALTLIAIVGGALIGAYIVVVPSLERTLVEAKLDQQQGDAETLAINYATLQGQNNLRLDGFVDAAGFVANSRVIIFGVAGAPGRRALFSLADSSAVGAAAFNQDPTALDAAESVSTVRARVRHEGREYAEVAVPLLTDGNVMLLSSSLSDQLATVALVKRRLVAATGVALVISLALGLAAAALHARRIRRLRNAADRIGEGAFDEPVVDAGADELGDLADSFDQMRIQLRQLDRARKDFVANASHELRTPLFSLAGFLELLSDEELDEATRRDFLAMTRSQVERLTALTADLLDLSRIDAGRIRIEREEVGLAEVARSAAGEMSALAHGSGHRVVVEADDDAWAVADEERVLQIARALTGNALVHTPPGTTVRIRAELRPNSVALVVHDDGPGIAGEHIERVFQRFYRVEGGHASGSGLGLAIARELGERMGGSVTVSSRPGDTTFTLELPAAAPTEQPGPDDV